MKDVDPLHFEKLFSRVRGGMVAARETALNISASPIVRELGEICFALYTPEGDNVALSTGIIVHVHTMSEAIKYMVRNGWEDNPGIRPGDIFANNQPTIGDVHNADVQTFVPIFNPDDPASYRVGRRRHPRHGHRRVDAGRRLRRADDALRRRHRPALHEDRRERQDRRVALEARRRCSAARRACTSSTSAAAWRAAT